MISINKLAEQFVRLFDQVKNKEVSLPGLNLEEATALRTADPETYVKRSKDSMRKHVEALLAFLDAGIPTFDYGNNIRQRALDNGFADAFASDLAHSFARRAATPGWCFACAEAARLSAVRGPRISASSAVAEPLPIHTVRDECIQPY